MATTTAKKTLVQALAAFQADLPSVTLDGDNPHFKSKFATLANTTNIVLPKLAEHGFAFSTGSFVDNGMLIIDAHLMHESGESRSMQFPITETNPQKIGSAVTYFRRYALAALTGVVADADDDGNTASAAPPKALENAQKLNTARQKAAPTKGATSSARDTIRVNFIDTGKVTSDQVNGLTNTVKSSTDLTGEKLFVEVLKRLEAGEVG